VPIHRLGFVSREVTMIGTNSVDLDQALEWIDSGVVEPEAMVTGIIPLDEIQAKGFEELTDAAGQQVKILVKPRQALLYGPSSVEPLGLVSGSGTRPGSGNRS
jgi:hypothetical protein